jgi:hypothetical protein
MNVATIRPWLLDNRPTHDGITQKNTKPKDALL